MNRVPGKISTERSAKILIERHGARAFDVATRQLAILHLAGADKGANNWRAIALEIERIQAMEREGGAAAHPFRPN